MDQSDSSWMMGMNMNPNYILPPQLPLSGLPAACTELFARRPDIFDMPTSGATIPLLQSAPPPDLEPFRNNFMLFQPQPEPPVMNAWMCGGGSGGGGGMLGGGMMSTRTGMAALMLPDDENETAYFAQSGNGGVGAGIGVNDMGDLAAGDVMMPMGQGGGCQAGWMTGRQPGGPSASSFPPASMPGLGSMIGHRNLLPDI